MLKISSLSASKTCGRNGKFTALKSVYKFSRHSCFFLPLLLFWLFLFVRRHVSYFRSKPMRSRETCNKISIRQLAKQFTSHILFVETFLIVMCVRFCSPAIRILKGNWQKREINCRTTSCCVAKIEMWWCRSNVDSIRIINWMPIEYHWGRSRWGPRLNSS